MYQELKIIYPNLDIDLEIKNGNIELRNDSDGNGAYLNVWNVSEDKPTLAQINTASSAVALNNAKENKKQELELAFNVASKIPVTVGVKTYNGGKESTQALRDYIQLVTETGGTSFTIWDNLNVISTYTLSDATAIKLAVATAVVQGEFNLRIKKNAVNDATTIEAVNAVIW